MFEKEVYGDETEKRDLLKNWKERLEQVPPETRMRLCELYKLAFAENVVRASDGSLKDSGITAASGSLIKIGEYLAKAPISRKLSSDIMTEILITADGGLSAVARGHFSKK